MNYTVLIERNSEDGYSEGAETLEDAARTIERYAAGRNIWKAFINGVRVTLQGGKCQLESPEVYEDQSIMEAMSDLGLRIHYGRAIRHGERLSFEEWKRKRPVPTNPATNVTIGEA